MKPSYKPTYIYTGLFIVLIIILAVMLGISLSEPKAREFHTCLYPNGTVVFVEGAECPK